VWLGIAVTRWIAAWKAPILVLCGHHVVFGVVQSAKTSSDSCCYNTWEISSVRKSKREEKKSHVRDLFKE